MDLVENEEYGYCSLIKVTNHVLEKMPPVFEIFSDRMELYPQTQINAACTV